MYSEGTHIKKQHDTLLKVKSSSTLQSDNQYQQIGIISAIQKLTAINKACLSPQQRTSSMQSKIF
jgi:hypothetical protein